MANAGETHWIFNKGARGNYRDKISVDFLREDIGKARHFHKSLPGYKRTPLKSLAFLAESLGVEQVLVKDEAYRLGLNAFKVLGCSYGMAKYLGQKVGIDPSDLTYDKLMAPGLKEKIEGLTFVTATDGNHGRGVAWMARQLGLKAVVYLPRGSAQHRLQSIRNEGAEAFITELNYDDTVRWALKKAEENNWILFQDTAWDGYEKIPAWIMQGYTTLLDEINEQLQEDNWQEPTHLILQAGAGSFAAAILGQLAAAIRDNRPKTAIVEPENAACFFASAQKSDGLPHKLQGYQDTIMAGLAVGEPSILGWAICRDYADIFFSCPDYVAAEGMRMLGSPLPGDPRVIAGESGAVTLGLLARLLQDGKNREAAQYLGISKTSRILLINTEGNTDPVNYWNVMWRGCFPSPEC